MVLRMWSPTKGIHAAGSNESSSTNDPVTSSSRPDPTSSPEESPQATTADTTASTPESTSSCEPAHASAPQQLPSWFPLVATKQPPPATPEGTGWLGLIAWLVKCARGMALAQMSLIWLIATAAASLSSFVGAMVLAFLIITRRYAPASLDYVRPLHFDYTAKDGRAVAISPLIQGQQVEGAGDMLLLPALSGARFLPSGQQIELWVEVTLPETERNQGVFQLVGELLAANSKVVARSSRPFMLKHQSPLVKMIRSGFALPWAVLGLYDESVQLQLHLFSSFEEREAYPVAYFRATMLPASGNAPLPLLYDAAVHIRLKLGFFQWVLYCMRPSLVVSWVLAMTGVSLLAGGSTCGILLLAVAVLVWYASRADTHNQTQAPKPAQRPSKPPSKQLPVLHMFQRHPNVEIEAEEKEDHPAPGQQHNKNDSNMSEQEPAFTAVDASSSRSHLTAAGKGADGMSNMLRRRLVQSVAPEPKDE